MAFSIRCNFPRITSYDLALKAWDKGAIFSVNRRPGPLWAPRGLDGKRKKHLTVQQKADAEIVLQLYSHPAVTWHKDNSFTIHSCSRSARSDGIFASHCTPHDVYVYQSGWHLAVNIDGRAYKVGDDITFRQHDSRWKADKITTPWQIPRVNRARAKEVLQEVGYPDFKDWFMAYIQMAPMPTDYTFTDDETVIKLLRDRKWRELMSHFSYAWNNPDMLLRNLRNMIYRKYGCIEQISKPFLG